VRSCFPIIGTGYARRPHFVASICPFGGFAGAKPPKGQTADTHVRLAATSEKSHRPKEIPETQLNHN
jgi:hypothetical protein